MTSLTRLFRERFLGTVQSISQGSEWKIVVMDDFSLKLFELVAEKEELLNLNVKAIESISSSRTKSPLDTAVYFLQPTASNVAYILQDFSSENLRMYKKAHLFFLAPIPDALFQKLSERVMRYCKSLKELFIDYIPVESKVFSLDMPNIFPCLLEKETKDDVKDIAIRLKSFFLSIGENPIIRHQDSGTAARSFSLNVATALHELLEQHKKEDPDFGAGTLEDRPLLPPPRPTLIIVERNVDLVSPLLHELTYQALVNDALNLEEGRKYKHTFTNGLDETLDETVILDERDQIWRELRYHHISDVTEKLLEGFKSLSKENAAAANFLQKDKDSVPTPSQMREIVAALPELQLKAKQYSLHIELARLSTELAGDQKILEAEQTLATGKNSEGDEIESGLSLVAPLVNRPDIPQESKLRLILLFLHFSYCNSSEFPDITRLILHANLGEGNLKAINNFKKLISFRKPDKKKPQSNILSFFGFSPEPQEPEYEFALSRHTPEVKRILCSASHQGLSTEKFPYTIPEDGVQLLNQLQAKKGLRITQPTWQKKISAGHPEKGIKDADELETFSLSKGRIIVFIIGGITYSEMRCANEVRLESRREVLVGATHILTPNGFIGHLKEIPISCQYIISGTNQPIQPNTKRLSRSEVVNRTSGTRGLAMPASSTPTPPSFPRGQFSHSSTSLPDQLSESRPELSTRSSDELVIERSNLRRSATKPRYGGAPRLPPRRIGNQPS